MNGFCESEQNGSLLKAIRRTPNFNEACKEEPSGLSSLESVRCGVDDLRRTDEPEVNL